MFSDHLSCDSVPLAFSLGTAPDSLPPWAPPHAQLRLGVLECAQFKSSQLLVEWQRFPQIASRDFKDFLTSPFDGTRDEDHELALTILSDLFLELVGHSLVKCTHTEICSIDGYRNKIRQYEPDRSKHEGLAATDGCFVGGYAVLIKGVRGTVEASATQKSWSSILRCALHEIGHRVFWPTEKNYIASELAAEYFAYSAWNRLRCEVLPTNIDIGLCRASGDVNYRKISLAAEHLVGLSALSCPRVAMRTTEKLLLPSK
jgi:hypothetical protein